MSAEPSVVACIGAPGTVASQLAEAQEPEIGAAAAPSAEAQGQNSNVGKYSDKRPFPGDSADNFEY